jgi:hypothetical protein
MAADHSRASEMMFIQGRKCQTILGGFPVLKTIFVIEKEDACRSWL